MMRAMFFCSVLLFAACTNKVNNATGNSENIHHLIESELGPGASLQYNADKTYLLAMGDKKATDTMVTYLLVDVSSGQVHKKGTFLPGYIKWIDNTSLELLNMPGTIPSDKTAADYKTIIRLKNNQ